jgi:hypothetical protein
MKIIFSFLFALALATISGSAFAKIDAVSIYADAPYTAAFGGKLIGVQVLSSEASGTAVVKAEQKLITVSTVVDTTVATNFTYSLVYSNGTEIVTNTAPVDYSPFPANMEYISYATNTVLNTLSVITNYVPTVAMTVTNALTDTITCTGGVGSAALTNKFVAPGDKLHFTGTAAGRVLLLIDR